MNTISENTGKNPKENIGQTSWQDLLERFDKAPLSRFHINLILAAGGGWTWAAFGTAIIGFIIPTLRTLWGLQSSELGLIASFNLIGMLVGSVTAGYLADRHGRKTVLVGAVAWIGITSIISALSWNYPALLFTRLLSGLGLGAVLPVASTIVGEYSPAKYRGRFQVLLNGFWGVGVSLAAIVGYLVVPNFGWREALIVGALAFIFAPVIRYYVPESLRFLLNKGRVQQALEIGAKIHISGQDIPTSQGQTVFRELHSSNQTEILKPGIWSREFRLRTACLWIVWFSLNFLFQGIFIWLPSILIAGGHSMASSFLFVIVISLSQIPGSIIAAPLVDIIGRRYSLIGFFLLFGICSLFFGLADTPISLLFWGSLVGLCNGATWSLAYPFTTELYPTYNRGSATGWATGFGRVGGIVAPFLVGVLLQNGLENIYIFMLFAAVCVITTLAIGSLSFETKGRTLEEITR